MKELVTTNQETKPLSTLEVRQQINVIQHVMRDVMQQNVHYGKIPGCKEPSLYKPGAEKIMATFRLSADPEVEDLSTPDRIHYRVKVRLHSPTGAFLGAGIGECSSDEEKYRWRRAVCPEEFDDVAPERKREKWCKGYNNNPPYKLQQIRTEPADLANTVLKMAKKRGLVDAVLTCTAASDCFTQDIEDLPAEYLAAEGGNTPPPVPTISEEQIKQLREAAAAAGCSEQQLCNAGNIDKLDDMLASRFNAAMNYLKRNSSGVHTPRSNAAEGAFGPGQ